jgi:hypothetical protein
MQHSKRDYRPITGFQTDTEFVNSLYDALGEEARYMSFRKAVWACVDMLCAAQQRCGDDIDPEQFEITIRCFVARIRKNIECACVTQVVREWVRRGE